MCFDPTTLAAVASTAQRFPSGEAGTKEQQQQAAGSDPRGMVTCLAVGAHSLLVGTQRPVVQWFARHIKGSGSARFRGAGEDDGDAALARLPVLQLKGEVPVGTAGLSCAAFGGPGGRDAVAATADGSLLRLCGAAGVGASKVFGSDALAITPLADCHVGGVVGVAAHPDGKHLLSCSVDGRVCAWSAADGQLAGRLDLQGVLSCLAVPRGGRCIAAVGSDAGVVRCVCGLGQGRCISRLAACLVSLPYANI